MIGRYQTAKAFRAALEERLKQTARAQRLDLMRLRRQVAFDRLLARLFAAPDAPSVPWLLKGGYAFELRLGGKARATKDLDLSVPNPRRLTAGSEESLATTSVVLDCLREAVEVNLEDGFEFRIGSPMTDLDTAPYGGARYPIEARLDNRTFATFNLDVGIGDAVIASAEWLTGPDTLGFAGIPPARVAALSREQQFAEKVHAFTLPRGDRTNTRVKDLIDLVLLIEMGLPATETVKQALQVTFARRGTHKLPPALDAPPGEWRAAFAQLAAEIELPVTTLDAAYAEVAAYWRTLVS
jgi:Nucleotidyl transferase AbiEii toxin, Type IV TA system